MAKVYSQTFFDEVAGEQLYTTCCIEGCDNSSNDETAFCDEHVSRCTCLGCGATLNCPFAWDGYNTDGDCLAAK